MISYCNAELTYSGKSALLTVGPHLSCFFAALVGVLQRERGRGRVPFFVMLIVTVQYVTGTEK
jgi:hypothetical protein